MANKVGIGVIGCGRWGQNLLRVFNNLPGARVLVCANKSNSARLDQFKTVYPEMETSQNVDDILGNSLIDAVVIVTPEQSHFDLCEKALEAGKHVFVEKPLAESLAQAKYLVDLAGSRSRILMVGQITQYLPAVTWIKERLSLSSVKIKSFHAIRVEFGGVKSDADLIWTFAIHDVAMIQYLLGNEPETVCAVESRPIDPGARDILDVNMTFPSGTTGHIYAGFAGPYQERRLILHTTQDIMVFDGVTGNVELFSPGKEKSGELSNIRNYSKMFEPGQKVKSIISAEPLMVECQHFLDCINTNQVPLSGGENVLAVMRTLDKIERSLSNKAVSGKSG